MRRLLFCLVLMLLAGPASAEALRVAVWNVGLTRDGPGQLLGDILEGDPQVEAVATVTAHVAPDVLLLLGVDWDLDGHALAALAERMAAAGIQYPYRFAARPNAGIATGLDLDGDGYRGDASDAQGFGRFSGEGGMALLSRYEIDVERVRDFSPMLWRDLPGARLPEHAESGPFPSPEAQAVQRLSSVGHWDVPVRLPSGREVRIWAFHATPPVFDGPEDRNGLRNHDEAAFWLRYLDGDLPQRPVAAPFVLMGDANADPADGDGRPEAIAALLGHPRLQDPRPRSDGAVLAARNQGGVNDAHVGDPALDTADWDDDDAGNLRVDYLLPAAELIVTASGVFWPPPEAAEAELLTRDGVPAARHHMVWADLRLAG